MQRPRTEIGRAVTRVAQVRQEARPMHAHNGVTVQNGQTVATWFAAQGRDLPARYSRPCACEQWRNLTERQGRIGVFDRAELERRECAA